MVVVWGERSSVSFWRIRINEALPDQMRGVFQHNETPIWQGAQYGPVPDMMTVAGDTVAVHLLIKAFEVGCGAMGLVPEMAKALVICTAAFSTRAVTGGQSHTFIQKEQFRITMWRHDFALSAFEIQQACHPGLMCPARHPEVFAIIMQDAAVSHHGPARRGRNDFTGW